MQGDGVHAAQRVGEADAVAPEQVQRRLAIADPWRRTADCPRAARGSCRPRHWRPARPRRRSSGWSPVTRSMIGEPRMRQRDIARDMVPARHRGRDAPARASAPRAPRAVGRLPGLRSARPAMPHIGRPRCSGAGATACEEIPPARAAPGLRHEARSNSARPAAASAAARAGSASSARDRRGQRGVVLARHQQAGRRRRSISSRGPCAAAATTGRAADQASSTTLPSGSWREGQTKTSQAASSAPVSSPPAEEGDALRHAELAAPARSQRRRAPALRRRCDEMRAPAAARSARSSDVEALVRMQPAHRQQPSRAGRCGQRGRRGAGEVMREIRQVVRALGGPALPHDPVARGRAYCRRCGRSAR